MTPIADNLDKLRSRIRKAVQACGRNPETVRLVAVSKTFPAETVREAIAAGQNVFGENYIQEAVKKTAILSSLPVSWHFIGHLQTNKAGHAVRIFDLIHSVDSIHLGEELNRQAKKISKVQKILIQVNTGQEDTKSGVCADDVPGLINELKRFENISIQGLMTLPPFFDDPQRAYPYFSALHELSDQIRRENPHRVEMKELSMGMTGDFEVAIKAGATLLRVGTAVFGKRNGGDR
ncbi:MAG: YggS family pyridoxal phosphate-dependent enzyme [Desulfobacterales bacterium]|nr:YggS family pyridoxal phosphate-dependent enzyme [Desulfobacterales bacterium]